MSPARLVSKENFILLVYNTRNTAPVEEHYPGETSGAVGRLGGSEWPGPDDIHEPLILGMTLGSRFSSRSEWAVIDLRSRPAFCSNFLRFIINVIGGLMKTTVSLFVLLSIIATGLVMHFVYLAKYDDPAIEYGYYGQFNRVQRNINEIPSVEIIDSWKHEDVTLEDFGFTIRIADGPERKIFFSDESPQKALKDDRKIKDFILSEYSQKEHD